MARKYSMDRRAYLKAAGSVGIPVAIAGCLGGNGDGGDGGDEGTPTPTQVTAGTAPGFPPFEFKDKGELKGFDVDLTEAVLAEAEGFSHEGWKEFEFDALSPALTSEKIDIIAAAMTITEERDETIDFSDPYFSSDQSVLVREDGDFNPSSLDDLSGHPVGAQKGTTGEDVVQKQLIEEGKLAEDNYKAYESYPLAVSDLENGNIDAVVIDQPVGETFAANRAVTVAFVYETGEQFGFGMRENDDDLQEAVNAGLAAVEESGKYEEITKTWFGE